MDDYDDDRKNIAQTLAEVLPAAKVLQEAATGVRGLQIFHAAIPKGTTVAQFEVDLEKHLDHPRKTSGAASFSQPASFLEYVKRHNKPASTVVWCDFNPQTFALKFSAVFDDHAPDAAGWRKHQAIFAPDFSPEWKAWKGKDRQAFAQVAFAEWIQEHDEDIATAQGLPTSLQMLEMATNFVMNEERALKSAVRLQSGGTRLTYIADPDQGTVETMQMFERFGLGIPVFQDGPAWSLGARLKYRNNGGKLSFTYELIRPDRVHKGAALEVIETIRGGLGEVPMLMGSMG